VTPCTYDTKDLESSIDPDLNILTQMEFPSSGKVRFNLGWCAIDETTLQKSILNTAYIFEIDDILYLDYATIKHGFWRGDDPSNKQPCVFIGAKLVAGRLVRITRS
jgi:hypothetical protein